MKNELDAPTGRYDDNYLRWKDWAAIDSFGRLDAAQEVYYRAELARAGVRSPARVLELGFGNGEFLAFCRQNSWPALGTEVNEALIEAARRDGYTAIRAAELGDEGGEQYDLVVAFDVLEHLNQDDLCRLVALIASLLRPGGVLLARFPNGDSPFGLSLQHGDITHLTTIGSGKVEYLAKFANLDIVFLGGPAQPLAGRSLSGKLRRLLIASLRGLLEASFKRLFFSSTRVCYFSPALVVCLRKPIGAVS